MNFVEKIARRLVPKAFDPLENIDLNKVVGWRTLGGSAAYGYYQSNQYENGYSSISKLANGFAAVEEYTIDKNGKPVSSNLIDRLYTPNTDMSAYDFREALAVTTLVHDKVRLRVHHKGNSTKFNMDAITGFTFMEGYSEKIVGGERYYMMPNGLELTDAEVVTLKSVNPYNVTDGFSPARAARRWTTLDDYIADYQKGFFENGAIPSGQMVITARTAGDFNDIVDKLQERHRGAGKNNNITYTHRPTDQNGLPLNSQIEWIPFASNNKELTLKELFEQVNMKIDSSYGVPAEIRGILSNSNYASVAVAEKVFVKYALNPMAMKIWSKFTHELNRITGGMGVAITYDLDIPVIADEDKVLSESKQVEASLIQEMVTAGYTLDTVVDAFDLPLTYKLLRTDGKQPVIVNDKPEVLTSDEARGTPDQPIDIYTKKLKLHQIETEILVDSIVKKLSKPAKKKAPLKKKQISDVDKAIYEHKYQQLVNEQMSRQVDKAVSKLGQAMVSKAYGDTTEEEDKVFTAAILALMFPLMKIYGNQTTNLGMNLILQAGLSTQDVKAFEFTAAQRKAYEQYVAKIGTSYADQTAQQIRDVLAQGILDGASRAEIENQLKSTILGPDNAYRAERLARTEVNLSEGKASVYSMENIQEDTGYTIFKVWHTSGTNPCPFCSELDGTEELVEESFLGIGESVHTADGGIFNNSWTDIDSAELHANCNCYTTFRVEKG